MNFYDYIIDEIGFNNLFEAPYLALSLMGKGMTQSEATFYAGVRFKVPISEVNDIVEDMLSLKFKK